MELLNSNFFGIQLLLEDGGLILVVILIASIVMWVMIAERYIFVYFTHPKRVQRVIDAWHQRHDRRSWYAQQIRRGMIAQTAAALTQYLLPIRTLVVVLPMLGLLGTVAGMIQTFDVLTVFGTGNARGMAGGISIALITTMGGLLTALSGIYFSTQLEQRAARLIENTADALRQD